jgi:hypothetical protein
MYQTLRVAGSQTLDSIDIMRGGMHTTVGFGGSPTLAYMNMVYVFNHIARGFLEAIMVLCI